MACLKGFDTAKAFQLATVGALHGVAEAERVPSAQPLLVRR